MSVWTYLWWFLFFMKIRGSMAPIDALDYGKMRSCKYLKKGSFTIRGGLVGWFSKGQRKQLSILKFVWCLVKLIKCVM
jgi:hypothetical protein